MKLNRKTLRTMAQYKVQFISMVIIIALGVGCFCGFHMEWYSLERNLDRFFQESGQADYTIFGQGEITSRQAQQLEQTDFILSCTRQLAFDGELENGRSCRVSVSEAEDPYSYFFISGKEYDPQSPDGIWLSDKFAAANGYGVDQTLTFTYGGAAFTGVIAGLCKESEKLVCLKDESHIMPDYESYGYLRISPVFYQKVMDSVPYDRLCIKSDLTKDRLQSKLNALTGVRCPVVSGEDTADYRAARTEVTKGKIIASVLPVLFLLVAILTNITTMDRLAENERQQIGTLKALGFKNRTIRRHYMRYPLLLSLAGSGLGVGLGYAIAYCIMNPKGTMAAYMDMPYWKLTMPRFCPVGIVLLIVLFTALGSISTERVLRGTAAQTLRPALPKTVRHSLSERLIPKRAAFGVKWNLRDMSRHKLRSLMTVVGVTGCMMLLVAALGLRDTMENFKNVVYDCSMQYESRLLLSRDSVEADYLPYGSTGQMPVDCELKGRTVSLEIYHIEDNMIRFADRENKMISLSDDGALISMRLAQRFGIRDGDSVSVTLYDSNKTVTVKVRQCARMLSESLVISDTYAGELGLPYRPTLIYSLWDADSISCNDSILEVQDKSGVMASYDAYVALIDLMIGVLLAVSALLGSAVLYNLGMMGYAERYRDMATLMVLGFRDKTISRMLLAQNLWLTVIGIAVGYPAGVIVLDRLIARLGQELEMKTAVGLWAVLCSAAVTMGVSLAVMAAVIKRTGI